MFSRSFHDFIPEEKYQLLKALAFAAHIGESRHITDEMVNEMNNLLDEFDVRVPDLYSVSINKILALMFENTKSIL